MTRFQEGFENELNPKQLWNNASSLLLLSASILFLLSVVVLFDPLFVAAGFVLTLVMFFVFGLSTKYQGELILSSDPVIDGDVAIVNVENLVVNNGSGSFVRGMTTLNISTEGQDLSSFDKGETIKVDCLVQGDGISASSKEINGFCTIAD